MQGKRENSKLIKPGKYLKIIRRPKHSCAFILSLIIDNCGYIKYTVSDLIPV